MYFDTIRTISCFTYHTSVTALSEWLPNPTIFSIAFLNWEPTRQQMMKLMEEFKMVRQRATKSNSHCSKGAKQKTPFCKHLRITGTLKMDVQLGALKELFAYLETSQKPIRSLGRLQTMNMMTIMEQILANITSLDFQISMTDFI